MINMKDNNNEFDPKKYWEDLIANLDGSYEEYKHWREILQKDNFEQEFERKGGVSTMTEYLMEFDDVVGYLDYLHDKALEIEDYRFCAVLLKRRLWAYSKNTAIDEEMMKVYAN